MTDDCTVRVLALCPVDVGALCRTFHAYFMFYTMSFHTNLRPCLVAYAQAVGGGRLFNARGGCPVDRI